MYQSKLAAAIKVGGKVLRESGNTVILPFGSEYSVFLKNMNSVRVLAKVEIDGQDVTSTKLIIEPNSSLELERFLRNGNLERGNRFKFIERTRTIEEHRGIKAEDGLVRVEFWTEAVTRHVNRTVHHDTFVPSWYGPWVQYPAFSGTPTTGAFLANNYSLAGNNVMRSARPRRMSLTGQSMSAMDSAGSLNKCNATLDCASTRPAPVSDSGITVAGSESNQRFVDGAWFPTDPQSEVVVLHLRGDVRGEYVTRPLTVDRSLICVSCGKQTLSSFKFCPRCGTFLSPI